MNPPNPLPHITLFQVPGAGLEPASPLRRGILSPLCLPISPPRLTDSSTSVYGT